MVRSTDGISFGHFDIFYMLLSTTGANQLDYQSYDSYIFRYYNKKMSRITWSRFNFSQPGGWFNIKMASNQYRKSHCGDKTILRPSYLHNRISYTGKMASLYWIGALIILRASPRHWSQSKMGYAPCKRPTLITSIRMVGTGYYGMLLGTAFRQCL